MEQAKGERTARVICLAIGLLGTIVVGVPFVFDVGPQMAYFLLIGTGLAVIGLAAFLFYSI
ncbi:MAG: hypothetical protein HY347_06060 [candidate division NC10 bacterium]|nr:hypothetical protein [candidate division NC10 bacterium]